jgi:hypothetical protein
MCAYPMPYTFLIPMLRSETHSSALLDAADCDGRRSLHARTAQALGLACRKNGHRAFAWASRPRQVPMQ